MVVDIEKLIEEHDKRDYDLADMFNTTKTKSDLYDKIIKYLTKE